MISRNWRQRWMPIASMLTLSCWRIRTWRNILTLSMLLSFIYTWWLLDTSCILSLSWRTYRASHLLTRLSAWRWGTNCSRPTNISDICIWRIGCIIRIWLTVLIIVLIIPILTLTTWIDRIRRWWRYLIRHRCSAWPSYSWLLSGIIHMHAREITAILALV
jgi:hypothetical protein